MRKTVDVTSRRAPGRIASILAILSGAGSKKENRAKMDAFRELPIALVSHTHPAGVTNCWKKIFASHIGGAGLRG